MSHFKVNFFSIFTRFRDIAALVPQNAIFSHPPLVSPKFPHVSRGVGGWRLGYKERRCRCIHVISSQDFQPMWSWSTNVTDRQTDAMDGALHCSASRGKKGRKMMWQTGYIWHVRCMAPGRVSKIWVSNRSVPKFRSYGYGGGGGSKIAFFLFKTHRLYNSLLLPLKCA